MIFYQSDELKKEKCADGNKKREARELIPEPLS